MNETPAQCMDRLLHALETLSVEADCLLRAGDYASACEVQARSEPLIVRLAELMRIPQLKARFEKIWKPRVSTLVDQCRTNAETLAVRRAELKVRLALVADAQANLTRLRPVYAGLSDLGNGALKASA